MTGANAGQHRLVHGEGGKDGLKVHIRLEIVAQPLGVGARGRGFDADAFGIGLEADPSARDHAFPFALPVLLPSEGLSRTQCGVEIVVSNMESCAHPGGRKGGCGIRFRGPQL